MHITIYILDYEKYFISTSRQSDFKLLSLHFIDLATSVAVFQFSIQKLKAVKQTFLSKLFVQKEGDKWSQ